MDQVLPSFTVLGLGPTVSSTGNKPKRLRYRLPTRTASPRRQQRAKPTKNKSAKFCASPTAISQNGPRSARAGIFTGRRIVVTSRKKMDAKLDGDSEEEETRRRKRTAFPFRRGEGRIENTATIDLTSGLVAWKQLRSKSPYDRHSQTWTNEMVPLIITNQDHRPVSN